MKNITGRFSKVAETENSIVVGLIGTLNEGNIKRSEILDIARFYGISTDPDKFGYHMLTIEGAVKRGCTLPVENYNGFLEIFK